MSELIAVALITILATISPGPDFAMVTRNSYLYGRKPGLWAALGIALGVQVHVCYTMVGVGLLIAKTPALFDAIKLVGATYLIYIGYKTFANRSKISGDLPKGLQVSAFGVLRTGFFTNALNPKTTLFVVSIYTQVVGPNTPWIAQFGYGLFMSVAHLLWFSCVAIFFSQPALRSRLLSHQAVVDKAIGAILLGLGISLAFANLVR